MDPLSITASIIAVLQLSEEVVKYITLTAGATKARKHLREELRACRNILQTLKDEADDSEEGKGWTETISALEGPGGPLGRLWAALRKIESELQPKDGVTKALASLTWPFNEKEIKEIHQTIEREKVLLGLALANNSRRLIQEIKKTSRENGRQLIELLQALQINSKESEGRFWELKNGIANIQDSQVGLHDGIRIIQRTQHHRDLLEERLTILNWLTPFDYNAQQSDFFSRRQAGTGQWLLDSLEFQTWLHANKQTLFCHGIPGAGKTILTSIIVDELHTRFGNDGDIGIAYIYCNFRRTAEQKAEDLLASMLKQLSQGRPSLPESVKALYNKHKEKRTRPLVDEILAALQSVIALCSRAFLVIDALDECQVSDNCRSIFLSGIFKVQANSANIFVTSRYIPEVTEKFKESMQLEIRATEKDVRIYLDNCMSPRRNFLKKNLALQEEIKTKIVAVVQGMFLLAQLHLDSLMAKTNEDDIESALKELPTGSKAYELAYDNAMERIEKQDAEDTKLAKQVLLWIVCAIRPLTTAELQHALAVRIGESEFNKKRQPDIEDVASVCAGLVAVDEKSDIIRLVHYTTQRYFELERTQSRWFPHAEEKITAACVTYLSFKVFQTGFCESDEAFEERLQSNRLYGYAANNWGHHARKVSTLCPEVIEFLQSWEKVEASSQVLMAMKKWSGQSEYSQMVPREITGLHLAAYFGVVEAVKAFLQKQAETDTKDTYGRTPLLYATKSGHEAVVKLLLEKGVEADSKDDSGQTPLSYAAEGGHEAVVKLLLEKGVEADSRNNSGQTPLSWAAERGHEAVVKLLLEKGVKADSKDDSGLTPLSYAAEGGHEAVVKLLLEKGVDADARDNSGQTPLSWAAARGHEAVVKLLLEKGVDADVGDIHYGQTPLSWAALGGYEAVVKLLRSHNNA